MESLNSNSKERELQQMQEEKVPSFLLTDDPLERLNKTMALLRSAITSRYPQATIQEGKVDMGKALNVNINSVNVKQPMAEVQLTTQHNALANEQQHSVQSELMYDIHLLEK
ncbi:hypothetical protein Tco_0884847, partial [Tanacetum coccineum]